MQISHWKNSKYRLWYRRYLFLAMKAAIKYKSLSTTKYILRNLHDLASFRAHANEDKRPENKSHFTYTMY